MTKGSQESRSSLSVFRFSYGEHEWDVDGEEAAREALLLAAAEHPWVLMEEVERGKAEEYCGVESLDDLLKLVSGTIVEEWNMPVDAVKIPLDRMSEMMRRDGWLFVGGSFMELEGHHNDSEIYVVLEKKG